MNKKKIYSMSSQQMFPCLKVDNRNTITQNRSKFTINETESNYICRKTTKQKNEPEEARCKFHLWNAQHYQSSNETLNSCAQQTNRINNYDDNTVWHHFIVQWIIVMPILMNCFFSHLLSLYRLPIGVNLSQIHLSTMQADQPSIPGRHRHIALHI